MKKINSNILLTVLLVAISLAFYLLQIIIYNDVRSTIFYFFQDIAFLPLQVAIVTIVLGKILNTREKRERLKKINIAISAFFSETGTDVIINLASFSKPELEDNLNLEITSSWAAADYKRAAGQISVYKFNVDSNAGDLAALRQRLLEKRSFLLNMLTNPNLLEHDTFTDMLWAVNHLTDELKLREALDCLPDSDLSHIACDINRALRAILIQWVYYMEHLQADYPYLFSLEVRRNPFTSNSVIVK